MRANVGEEDEKGMMGKGRGGKERRELERLRRMRIEKRMFTLCLEAYTLRLPHPPLPRSSSFSYFPLYILSQFGCHHHHLFRAFPGHGSDLQILSFRLES
jgi:hypothetical protein